MIRKAAFLALLFASAASAKPSFSVADAQCQLGLHCTFTVTKTGLATSYSDILFTTTGSAGEAVKVSLRFLKADTVKTVPVASLGVGQFTATIKSYRYAVIVRSTATGTVTAAPAPVPAPAPSPEPTPAPIPASGWVPSPTLAGAPPITSITDLSSLLPQPIPASAAPDYVGAFRFDCQAGQINRDDSMVYPGQPGKSHLHQYYGNTLADAFSTYLSLRTTGQSTCMNTPFNRSAYWMPAMLDGLGNVVKPAFVAIYYKRRPRTDPNCQGTTAWGDQGKCVALPNALNFIFGYDMVTGKAPSGFLWFNCQGPGSVPGHYSTITEAAPNCPVGAQLGAIIEAPECWDGKNLDSPNHRDHVDYASYGTWGYKKCDAAHPYVIPTFTLGAWYTVSSPLSTWRLSCDDMIANPVPGKCFHADFRMAWEPAIHDMWEQNDLDKLLNASAGDLGNGFRIPGAEMRPDPSPRLVPVPPMGAQ